MRLRSRILCPSASRLDQTVISPASCENVPLPICIEDTLEQDASTVELLIQASQWGNVDLSPHLEAFQI